MTNGLPSVQHDKVRIAGIGPLVDAVIVSGSVGFGKPRPEIFDLALSRLRVEASRSVMVGDHLDHDIRGAVEAGLGAIWCVRGEADAGSGPNEVGAQQVRGLSGISAELELMVDPV